MPGRGREHALDRGNEIVNSMIDLHLHILPGVDDGPQSLSESIAMLDWFAAAGYSWLVATPHLMEPLNGDYASLVRASLQRVQAEAVARGLRLGLGYEHMVSRDLPARLAAGEATTLAGSRAVLVEFPFIGWDYTADRVLFDLQQRGFRPILAHPERYVEVQKRPELVEAIAERGGVLQITHAAVAGTYGADVRSLARRLVNWCVDAGLPFLLASDAHSPGRRLTDSTAGRTWVARNVDNGEAVLEWAGSVVPQALLTDQAIPRLHDWLADQPVSTAPSGSRWRRIRALNPLAR